MPTLPTGLTTHAMHVEDVDDVVVLLQLVDLRTIGQIETSPADLRSWIAAPDVDLAQDSIVVRNGSRVDAWGLVERVGAHIRLSTYVHPDWWALGDVDEWLLDEVERRGIDIAQRVGTGPDGIEALTIVTPWDDHRVGMLAVRGFLPVRRHRRLEARFDRRSPEVPRPEHITLRSPEGWDDLRAMHRVIAEAFRDELGRAPSTWEQFKAEHVEHEDFDASLWFLAEAERSTHPAGLGDGPLGAIVARDDKLAGSGWVSLLAVRESARGVGVGLALLTSAFRAFHDRGVGRVELGVDSHNLYGAQSLYERAGMQETAVLVRHRLDLPRIPSKG